LLHSGQADFNNQLRAQFFAARDSLPENEPIAILIDSPGGYAKSAYQVAHILRTHCGDFTAVIPRYCKSAATLFALGADTILISKYAE
jgi:ClpP class serine protease